MKRLAHTLVRRTVQLLLLCGFADYEALLAFPGNSARVVEQRNTPDDSRVVQAMRIDAKGTPRALYDLCFSIDAATPQQVATGFIERNAGLLGLRDDAAQIQLEETRIVPGGQHLRFSQVYSGIPVYHGELIVTVNDQNQVVLAINNSQKDIHPKTTTPVLTQHQAIRIGALAIQKRGKSIGKEDDATLMAYKADDGTDHLIYRVRITSDDPVGDWEILVDAVSGAVLHLEDLFVMHTSADGQTATGYAYVPDPLSASRHRYNDPGFVNGNDADTDSLTYYRTLVQLDSLLYEDGLYKLQGPYCTVTEIEAPSDPAFYGSPSLDGFQYTRSQPGFEAVNIYYHVYTSYRHLQDLGFESATLRQIRLDPHGFQGEDNSHFSPSGNWISWGTEGVDDAEDATAIWHEYAHAIQYSFVPSWGGGESGALGEGFADYWAASYARSVARWTPADEQYNWVFGWDGHNPYWLGRTVKDSRTYPFGTLPIHSAGQIWSSALMGIWQDLGRDVTDKLVLKSMLYLGSQATGPDQAYALLQADRDLYGGQHLQTLIYWLGTVKHFLNPTDFAPSITHTPLTDTQDASGPFVVRASVHSPLGIREQGVQAFWSCNGGPFSMTLMMPTGNPEEFACAMPHDGTPGIFTYYLAVTDSAANLVTLPPGAPGQVFRFQAGTDTTTPRIVHFFRDRLGIRDSVLSVSANVVDNTLIDSVWMEYTLSPGTELQRAPLARNGPSTYVAQLALANVGVDPCDSLTYRIVARDASGRHNTSTMPADGFFTSALVRATGSVLLVDDGRPADRYPSPSGSTAGNSVNQLAGWSSSAHLCAEALLPANLVVDWVTFAELDTLSLEAYDVIMLSGGSNPKPFDDTAKRAGLVAQAMRGAKILTEGSEVGQYYQRAIGTAQERDPQFRQFVLHTDLFAGKRTGDSLMILNAEHPLWNMPNRIRGAIHFGAALDSVAADALTTDPSDAGTSIVAGWSSSSDNGGIIIHESAAESAAPATMYFTFSIASLADTVTARLLVRNAVDYLLPRSPATAVASPERIDLPEGFSLGQNYPNPFNPATTIQFALREQAQVTLKVFGLLGQEVATLVNAVEGPGLHTVTWNGTSAAGAPVATGVYFYRIEARGIASGLNHAQTRKMHLIR